MGVRAGLRCRDMVERPKALGLAFHLHAAGSHARMAAERPARDLLCRHPGLRYLHRALAQQAQNASLTLAAVNVPPFRPGTGRRMFSMSDP